MSISVEDFIQKIKGMPYDKQNHTHDDYVKIGTEAVYDLGKCAVNRLNELSGGKLKDLLNYDAIDHKPEYRKMVNKFYNIKSTTAEDKMRIAGNNARDMLQGCYNRIHVTHSPKEIGGMYESGVHHIAESLAIAEELQGIRKMPRASARSYSPDLTDVIENDTDYQFD